MRVAALDLGSNTFLLFIADVKDGKIHKVYKDETRVVRLGDKVSQTGEFSKESLLRAEKCFKEYRDLIERNRVDKIVAVATSAARDVKNKADFLAMAQTYGIPIEVIAGEREAEISFLGTTFDHPRPNDCCVIDIGGGSTEFIGTTTGKVKGISLDIGSVRGYDKFIKNEPPGAKGLKEISAWAKSAFESVDLKPFKEKGELIAVAGTPTTLACMVEEKDFDEKFVNGFLLGQKTIAKWIDKIFEMSIAEREAIKGMPKGRGDVLPVGAVILLEAMKHLDQDELYVSTRGVRHGLALKA
jgi:exopolyphosphatase/guanosine-5'-triphosphate,3'-diphosphate pyrophosphatase